MGAFRATAVTLFCISVCAVLSACGGSSETREYLPYFLLDGTPGRFILAEPHLRGNPAPRPEEIGEPTTERGVRLVAVIRTGSEMDGYRVWFETLNVGPVDYTNVKALTEPTFFEQNMVLAVDVWTGTSLERSKISSIVETENGIEIVFEICSEDTVNMATRGGLNTAWLSVRKSAKPVAVLPIRVAQTPPYYPGQIGRCVV